MISEVDIRDWDFDEVRTALLTVNNPITEHNPQYDIIYDFINNVEKFIKSKEPQVAALFKEKK